MRAPGDTSSCAAKVCFWTPPDIRFGPRSVVGCFIGRVFVSIRPAERPAVLPLANEEREMDLNYLYYRQQVSKFMAENAQSLDGRRIHSEFAERYAAPIAEARSSGTHLRAV